MANPGDKFIYNHPAGAGYGEDAKGQVLTAEMTEMDLKTGTEVTVLENDAESGWPLVEWVDGIGINRITTIDPVAFSYFEPVTKGAKL
jgi:hypothetical protein